MVNRIQEILNKYDLTAARFADQLDVPRSTISHILSERNKPSLEFIQKVLEHYPEISTNWLVKGEGTIFEREPDLFSIKRIENSHEVKASVKTEKEIPSVGSLFTDNSSGNDIEPILEEVKPIKKVPENTDKQLVKSEIKAPADKKKITRIITFYTDNTFDEFFPASRPD